MSSFIDIHDLKVYYSNRSSSFKKNLDYIKAVDGISLTIPKGKTLGIVGESGSGKSTLVQSIVRLAPIYSGSIYVEGTLLNTLSHKQFFPYKKRIQMIFQDPFSSLNPKMSIYSILDEPLSIHFKALTKQDKQDKIAYLLKKVQLSPDTMKKYPHEFSGGQRQRIGIARALAVEPECIICDEPVSALDVCVQAHIINLLQDLQDELGLTYLFISHDLPVVEHISHHIAVIYQGKIVEQGPSKSLCTSAKHPYTQNLIQSIPGVSVGGLV